MDHFGQWFDTRRLALKRIRNQPLQIVTGEGCKDDLLHGCSSLTDRFQLAHQGMRRIDFIVPVGADQQQVAHIRLGEEILEKIKGCRVEPLQVVEEQGERMLRSCEHADKSPEHKLEAALRILGWKIRNRRLVSDDECQFRNEVDNEQRVWAECLLNGIVPDAQLLFPLAQERTDKTLKRLRQSGIRNVALVLVELAGGIEAARWNERLVEFIDDGGLADAGISGNEQQLRPAVSHDAVEGGEQGLDLGCSAVQFLRNQQPVRRVVFAKRKLVDAAPTLPFGKTAPQITLNAGRRLVALLGSLGEQLHDDGRNR